MEEQPDAGRSGRSGDAPSDSAADAARTAGQCAEDFVGAAAIGLLVAITLANVLVRYFTNDSFAWTEEISVFLMVLMTLAAASAAMLRDRHIRIDILLASGRHPRLAAAGIVACALFFLAFTWLSGRVVWDEYHYAETSMGIGVPRWWYTIWVPAFSLAIAGRALQAAARAWRAAAANR